MKQRKLFYRKKGKATMISGKLKGITTDLLTLPNPNRLAQANFDLVSFLSSEKLAKLKQKVECLDYAEDKPVKTTQEVPIIKIKRTFDLDTKKAELKEFLQKDLEDDE